MYKPTVCATPRVNHKANDGLLVVMMRHGEFALGKTCTILVMELMMGGCACVESGSIQEISASSSHFYCKPKTALKK